MAAVGNVLIFVLLILLLLFGSLIALAVYVARDARRRGMNAVLWVLVVLLVPGYVGLIIYLLVRPSAPLYQCSQCGQPVERSFARCPYCGAQLLASCPNCGQAAQPEWKLCPHCGTELTASDQVHPPVRRKDRLWVVLAVVGALIVAFALLIVFQLISFSTVGGASFEGSIVQEVTSNGEAGATYALAHIDPGALQGNVVTSEWYRTAREDTSRGHVLSFQTEEAAGGILLLAGDANRYEPLLGDQPLSSQILLTLEEIEQSGGTSVWVFWYDTGENPVPWGIESDLAVDWTESDQPGALESLCRDWAGVQADGAGEVPAIGG